MEIKLSASLIVKNEEVMLERCLKSLKGVDEIVIVDTGSQDKTIKIAKKYGKVLTDYKWCDNFAEARNHCLDQCTGDYNLIIDADMVLDSPVDDIRKELEDMGDYNALEFDIKWHGNGAAHKLPMVFKKGLRYKGKIHESIACNKKPTELSMTYYKSPTHDTDPDRNLRILKSIKDKEPRDMFYLANEYRDRNNLEEALKWYKEYLKVATWRYEIADANLEIAKILFKLQKGDEARDYCLQAILGNPNFKEALKFMGEMSWDKEKVVWDKFSKIATNEDVVFIR